MRGLIMKNDLMIANNSLAIRNFDLPSPENFEAYSRAVNNIPMLSEESEKALSIRWFNEKDIYAAKDLKYLIKTNYKVQNWILFN